MPSPVRLLRPLIAGFVLYMLVALLLLQPLLWLGLPSARTSLLLIGGALLLSWYTMRGAWLVDVAVEFDDRARFLAAVRGYARHARGYWELAAESETALIYDLTLRVNRVALEHSVIITLAPEAAVLHGPREAVERLVIHLERTGRAQRAPLIDSAGIPLPPRRLGNGRDGEDSTP